MDYPIDPELAAAIPELPRTDLSGPEGLAAARAGLVERVAAQVAAADTTGITIAEVSAPGWAGAPEVSLRTYRPPMAATGPLPVIFDIHGGGFVNGSVDGDHLSNLEFCRELSALVVSVEYRLAPENPFPAALEDCYAGLCWLAENAVDLAADPSRIVVYGSSAGAGLAAGLALLARDRGGPGIAFQLLNLPELDDRLTTPSMRAFTDTPQWNRPKAEFSWNSYLGEGIPGTAGVSPYAAAARETDLRGLPPAYISVAEFDPLRDEGIDYARALLAGGVGTELHLFPGTFHGSGAVADAEISRRQRGEVLAVLRRALGPAPVAARVHSPPGPAYHVLR